jgi:hypothetical protein
MGERDELAALYVDSSPPGTSRPAKHPPPASVILTRATSICLPPAIMRSAWAGREPGADELDQDLDRKSVREH